MNVVSKTPEVVAVYVRCSTDEKERTTLQVQNEACRHFILSQGWLYREDLVFVDDGWSGASLDRPGITRLRDAIRQGEVDAVVVYKLDRLSRNLAECIHLVTEDWAGLTLHSTKEHLDTKSPVGQMVFNIVMSFAQFERDLIKERTQSGKRKRASEGKNAGFKPSYGYLTNGQGFRMDLEAAAVVQRIYRTYIQGSSYAHISQDLNNDAIPAANGGRWRPCSVRSLLMKDTYTGIYRYSDYEIPGVYPIIITPEEFQRAQDLRLSRGKKVRYKSEYLLSGLLRCGKCKGAMIGKLKSSPTIQYRYYRCCNVRDFKSCDCGLIPADDVERVMLEQIRQHLAPQLLSGYQSQMTAQYEIDLKERRQAVDNLLRESAIFAHRRSKLDEDYYADKLSAQSYDRLYSRLDQEINNQANRLRDAQVALQRLERNKPDASGLQELASKVDVMDYLIPEEKKMVLKLTVAEVTVYRQKGSPMDIDLEWEPRFGNLIS